MRTKASGYPSWPGVTDSTEGRIHWRRPTAVLHFRLQLCGGPYIPIDYLGKWNYFELPVIRAQLPEA
jgi:hypothetical protein